jgi:hypothetical protein
MPLVACGCRSHASCRSNPSSRSTHKHISASCTQHTGNMVETDAYVVEKYRKFVRHMMLWLRADHPCPSLSTRSKPIPSITMLWHTPARLPIRKLYRGTKTDRVIFIEVTYSRWPFPQLPEVRWCTSTSYPPPAITLVTSVGYLKQ